MVEKLNGMPEAFAQIEGSAEYPEIHGMVYFFEVYGGTIVMAEIYGLPDEERQDMGRFFAFHIHEGGSCGGNSREAFPNTGMHFNPQQAPHPDHAGDLPPLLSTHGAAWNAVYTGRFYPEDVVGKTVVIHSKPDDFKSQPAGDSGEKIACGEIMEWQMEPDVMEPRGMQPPDRMDSRETQLDTMLPRGMQPDQMDQREMQPDTMMPRGMQPDRMDQREMQPDTMLPRGTQPDRMDQREMQPGTMMPNRMQPGGTRRTE